MRIFLIAVLLIMVASALWASTAYELSLKNNYVGPDSGATFYAGRVAQGSVTLSGRSGEYAGVWGSLAIDHPAKDDGGKEVDVYVGKAQKIGKVGLDLGVNYYGLAPLQCVGGDLVAVYANVDIDQTISGWKPRLHVEHDFTTDSSKCPAGTLIHLSFARQIGKMEVSVHAGGHPDSFGIPAEPLSFVAMQATVPSGKDTSLSLRLQKATGRAEGIATDTATLSWTWRK